MKLSVKSWHHRLHSQTYVFNAPKNLCPYFWQVVGAIIMFVPLAIWTFPYAIIAYFTDRKYSKYNYPNFLDNAGVSVGVNIACAIVYCWVDMWFRFKKGWTNDLVVVFGLATLFLMCFILLMWGMDSLQKRVKESRSESKPNILKELVKAKYRKMCPMIEWEKEND